MTRSGGNSVPGGTTRRSMLVASGAGAGLLAGISAAPAPAQAPAAARGAGRAGGISPRDLGAIGDGHVRFLSERFATLDAARAVYPFATRLDQSLDWAGIQAALDLAEPICGAVVIPVGRFIISDTLRVPSAVTLQGESRNGSVIDNQNWPLDAPQLANKDPLAFLYATIRNLTLHGGTHGLKVDAAREVAGIVIEGVTTNMQSEANLDFSSLQTCVLRDCHLMDGRFGLDVRGFPCNSVHLVNTRIGRHSDASIRLRGVDGFVMLGGSIEAGITPGAATIDIETGGAYAQAIAFEHVYFENTHTILLRSRGARAVSFGHCKFTGTGAAPAARRGGGPGAYRFDCGEDMISFAGNFFHVPTTGPGNMLMAGHNHGLMAGGTLWRQRDGARAVLTSRRFSPAEAASGLFSVALTGDEEAAGGGRVWGTLELFAEPGGGRPLRRTSVPLDLLLGAPGGAAAAAASPLGPLALAMREDGAVRLRLNGAAEADSARALWFALDLSHAGEAVMDVDVL